VRYGVVPAKPQKRKVPLGTGPGLGAAGAGNFPDFLYRGGPIIANPQVHVVFLGDWSSTEAQTRAADIQQFSRTRRAFEPGLKLARWRRVLTRRPIGQPRQG
jgi:hypothetical protein